MKNMLGVTLIQFLSNPLIIVGLILSFVCGLISIKLTINLFKSKILEIDPTAFFVISDCYEVQGGVKRSNLPFI